jgi:Fe-S metabolism associated domain
VVPEMREGKIYWRADSDAQLTKGLAALLVNGLSGCTPAEVATVDDNFIDLLGLKQSLTPSRNNGFLNMFRLMQACFCPLTVPAPTAALLRPPYSCWSSRPCMHRMSESPDAACGRFRDDPSTMQSPACRRRRATLGTMAIRAPCQAVALCSHCSKAAAALGGTA